MPGSLRHTFYIQLPIPGRSSGNETPCCLYDPFLRGKFYLECISLGHASFFPSAPPTWQKMAGLGVFARCLLFLLLVKSAVGPGEESIRYLLYSVNPGEGFNLRRDVYMRAANLVKTLRSEGAPSTSEGVGNWVLVLPPWPHLHHWRSRDLEQWSVRWERFFDVPSLNEYVPVIEFDDYVKREGTNLEEVRSSI